jgi:hypothetical protein
MKGKRHEMPAHHKLEAYLDEYVRAAGIAATTKATSSAGLRPDRRTHRRSHAPVDAWRMIQRRAAELGMKVKIGYTFEHGNHGLPEAGGTLENAQHGRARKSAHHEALRSHRR